MDVSIEMTGLITLGVSAVSGFATYWKTRKREANTFFEKLFDQFNKQVFSSEDNQIEQTLSLLSQVCYYKEKHLITEKQFHIFEDALKQYLARKNVQQHMCNMMSESQCDEESSAYYNLLPYMPEGVSAPEKESVESKASGCCTEVSSLDFQNPTMIIKVNRLYREGMSTEEVYNTTRQWWRVNEQRAKSMKYALAVVHGIVKEVFEIESWRRGEEDERPGRWSFKGRVADEVIRKRFVNKSVKHLFKKGDMCPIRYFDGVR